MTELEHDTEESELAAQVARTGYLETAPCPVDFTDIGDYLDDNPERTRAEHQARCRNNNVLPGPESRSRWAYAWGRQRMFPSRDEWTSKPKE